MNRTRWTMCGVALVVVVIGMVLVAKRDKPTENLETIADRVLREHADPDPSVEALQSTETACRQVAEQFDEAILIRAARGERWEPAVLLAATTGARRSEVLALRWSDVDLDTAKARITRGLHLVRDAEGGRLIYTDPKTNRGRREISLPPTAVVGLRRWRQAQVQRRLAIGAAWIDDDLICDRGDGGPCDPDSLTRAFPRLAKKAGLPAGIRLHDVRHGVATAFLEQGLHPAIASAALGHSSEAFTMSQYQHVSDRMTEKAAVAIEAALRG